MVDIIRLEAHDPLPDDLGRGGGHVLVFRRFGEDDPSAVLTSLHIVGRDGHVSTHVLAMEDGSPLAFETAIERGVQQAEAHKLHRVYALNRIDGERERDVLRHHGDHSVHMDKLQDTDEEDGERGTDLRDRGTSAGFLR